MRAQLVPLHNGPPIDIRRDLTVIGRKEDCDLRLDHKGVSKLHCLLVKTDDMLLLRDLGSTNGTRVNGRRVRRAALMQDDEIRIAGVTFRVTFTPADGPARPYEHTQEMGAAEIESLRHADQPVGHGAAQGVAQQVAQAVAQPEPLSPPAAVSMRINTLPDVYPLRDKDKDD